MPERDLAYNVTRYLREEGLTDEEFAAQIAGLKDWFHHFRFSTGAVTPGRDPSPVKLAALDLPERLDGRTVLDVGAVSGFFAFECERRGAARVVACDDYVWNFRDYLAQFRLVHRAIGSRVEERRLAVEDLAPEAVGTFDIVLFLGVLYHAPNMMAYLDRVRSVTKTLAVVETLVDMLDVEEPAARYYPPI